MLVEKDIQRILNQLARGYPMEIACGNSDIMIRFLDDASKLSLKTLVYRGGNYIPSSVRRCLSAKAPCPHASIRTFFTIDEPNYQIYLNYLGHPESISEEGFKDLLEEFDFLAEKWRVYLDEHDKNDLIYVRVK